MAFSAPADHDPAAQVLRNVAIYRFLIFGILVYEWNHYLLPVAVKGSVTDAWFTYDQFEFLYQLAPSDPGTQQVVTWIGTIAGIIAATGGLFFVPFRLAATVSITLYLFRFLAFVHLFTNHNYLFALLAILTTISGGGSFFLSKLGRDAENDDRRREIQRCENIAITIRMQYAVVYFFASLWKLHPDWLAGHIVKGIMLTFEDHKVARGVPWHRIYQYFPNVFVFVALGGLVLDTGMFLALTFRRPSKETSRMFILLSAMFHGFVCFTMSQRIGYTFPVSCLAGSVLFQPIGSELVQSKKNDNVFVEVNNDTDLVSWTKRYITGNGARATPSQRFFTLSWLFVQLALPFRMPIISDGSFPYTSKCYRFSWTMMLHSRSTMVSHKGSAFASDGSNIERTVPLEFMYLLPECKGSPIQRKHYMPESANAAQDPRTLPLNHVLGVRHMALINLYPRYIARVASGMSDLLYDTYPDGCQLQRVSVYGVHFAKLNDNGAFHRMFDPTVDLAAMDARRKKRSWKHLFWDVLFDQAPRGRNEYLLSAGVGGSKYKVDRLRREIQQKIPGLKRIEFIADRAECLAARPLSLWLEGFPLGVLPLEVPVNSLVYVDIRERTGVSTAENQWDGLMEPERISLPVGRPRPVTAASVEIGIATVGQKKFAKACSDTDTEDVIIALLFMA